MPRYDFGNGGDIVDALTSYMAKEEADKRQKMIDAINAKNITSQIADRESNRRIQEENATSQAEVRAEQAQKARHEAYLKRVSQMDIGDEIDPELLKQAKAFGYGNDFGPAPVPKAPLPAPAPPEGIATLPPPPPGMSSPVKSVNDTTQAPPATSGNPVQVVDAQTGDKLTFKNAADAEEFQKQNNMVKPEQPGPDGPPMGIPQGGPPPQGPPPGMMSGPPSGPPPMPPAMPAQPPPGPSGPPLGVIAGPPPAPPKMVYKGSAQQRQRAAMTEAIAGAKDRVEAGKIAIQYGVPYNQVDDIVNSMFGRKVDPEGASPVIPVVRIGRDGSLETVGNAPPHTHFANEPAPVDHSQAEASRAQHSYDTSNTLLEKKGAPYEEQARRMERLQVSIAQKSPQSDALIAPELLTAMAGGTGSGLRMNEAEISRIIGGRSNWESIKAAVNRWRPGDAALSITDAQRADISRLVGEMNSRISRRLKVLDQAHSDLINADGDVKEQRNIVLRATRALAESGDSNSGLPAGVTVEREK